MVSNTTSLDSELVYYAIVYPGVIAGAISVFALFNPRVGTPILFATAVVGGLMYVVCDTDNRSRQVRARRNPNSISREKKPHFEQEPVDMNRGPLTGRVTVLGVGLCFFGLIGLSILYVVG